MGEQKNTIVINGKVYNASKAAAAGGRSQGKSLEGFMFGKPLLKNSSSSPQQNHIVPISRRRAAGAHKVHHRRDHADTLMRSAVTKPRSHRPSALSGRLEPDNNELAGHDDNSVSINARPSVLRKKRARDVTKSNSISRFSYADDAPVVTKKTAPIKVKTSPEQPMTDHYESTVEGPAGLPTVDTFGAALSRAVSHLQLAPKHKHARHKVAKKLGMSSKATNTAAIILIVLALGGFIGYQNLASISLRAADSRAGIHASLPSYWPAGFAFSRNIKASPGQIVLSFHSNSDDRSFRITQNTSDWNSQTLLENYVAATEQHYQQIDQDNGKTVFTYGDANATWVDGGIWYKIEGNSILSNDQLLKIANSF